MDVKRCSPLQPRLALVGGRTEKFAMHMSRKVESKEMKYLDVSFLYLYVKMRSAYPMGHLDLILVATEHQNQLSKKADKATAANLLQAPVSSTGDKAGESVDFRLTGQRKRFSEVEPSLVHSRQTQLQKEQMFSKSFLSQLPFTFVESHCWKKICLVLLNVKC